MTERGLPTVDGAQACPFVAFADDRDERATSPDHRHRCYAEASPAPRALAHQEAYCLSSAFPICPTFQDWARREAARARPVDVPPGDVEDVEDLPSLVGERPPRRTTPGTWAAPPPWLRGTSAGGGGAAAAGATGAGAPGAAGSPPGRAPQRPPADAGAPIDAAAEHPGSAGGALASAGAGGLSGSFADRLVSGASSAQPAAEPEWRVADAWDDELGEGTQEPAPDESSRAAAPVRATPPSAPQTAPRRPTRERLNVGGGDDDERPHDAWAPAWERPRRLEAYPTLRSRRFSGIGLPSLLLAIVAVLIAGVALFFLPSLLGIGGPPAGASPTPTTLASVEPSGSVGPTEVAAPTPQTYVVQSGDTMFKIAKKFGIPIGTLIAANAATIPNPDVLKVGDVVIIPSTLPTEIPGASTTP